MRSGCRGVIWVGIWGLLSCWVYDMALCGVASRDFER
jgi:hypothetical protein